jgi:hypothetical protein
MTDARRNAPKSSTGRTVDVAAWRRTKIYREAMHSYTDAVRRSAQHLLDELDAYEAGL